MSLGPHHLHGTLLNRMTYPIYSYYLNSKDIDIISSPDEFYKTLLLQISKAKTRILISSLYIGTGQLEVKLIAAIAKQLQEKPQLKVQFILDLNRSNRRSSESGPGGDFSTVELLKKLDRFNERVSITLSNGNQNRLYERREQLLSKIIPYALQELKSVHHMKAYIFDDNVLISGANLSTDYFTSRCDRYILFNKTSLMAKEMTEFFELLKDFGYSGLEPTKEHNKYDVPFKFIAEQTFSQRNKDRKHMFSGFSNSSNIDTVVSLYFSLPGFGMPVERDLMSVIYALADSYPEVPYEYATMTAYFNMDMHLFNGSSAKPNERYTFITSEISNNSFTNAWYPKGLVPYIMLENIRKVLENENDLNISVYEYNQPKQTFHGKGVWLIPLLAGHFKLYYPSLYVFGSSNYGYRSLNRDSELGVVLSTNDMHLKNRLNQQLTMFMDKSLVSTLENVNTRLGWRWMITRLCKHFFIPFL